MWLATKQIKNPKLTPMESDAAVGAESVPPRSVRRLALRASNEVVRADQTHPTNHPFAPPSTDCGRREKGEGKIKISQKNPPYKWTIFKRENQIYFNQFATLSCTDMTDMT